MEVERLLEEFPPVTTQQWEDIIHQDLKGADYAKRLIWHSPEGIDVKPFYRQQDIAALTSDEAPGDYPYLRGTTNSGYWRVREEIDAADPEQANREAQRALAAGAEEISFRKVRIENASDLALLMVNLQTAPLRFENGNALLIDLVRERWQSAEGVAAISMGMSPLADTEFTAATIRHLPEGLVPFTICGKHLEEQGASTVHELAFALAAGIDYLAEMSGKDVDLDRAAAAVEFAFSTGASYFFQIAKFRAFRALWAQAVTSFGVDPKSARARISARTSTWNKTIYDPHVNVLRAATEAMSAVLGGVDSVCIAAFDECYKMPDEASRRLARNTQLMLKHEALLAHVADPGAGAYYLESITESVAREAWKLMQRIEQSGGYRQAADAGLLDELLQDSRMNREKAVISRRRVFTGTNQYADPQEKALGRIDTAHVEEELRGAFPYEQLRLRIERFAAETGRTPRVLLAEFGDLKMRAARSNFALNVFACAGFETTLQRIDDADAIGGMDADLIVLCSADAEYLQLATALGPLLKQLNLQTPVIVAGLPENAGALRAAGIADFIHIRSNPIEVLTHWQQRLGMRF